MVFYFLGQIPVPDEEEALAPQIEPQLNNIDFLQGKDQAFGVGSASIQSLNEEPQEVIDIVEYDATIPGDYQLLCWVWIIEKLQFLLLCLSRVRLCIFFKKKLISFLKKIRNSNFIGQKVLSCSIISD